MKQIIFTKMETFELYMIALSAVALLDKEVKQDRELGLDEEIRSRDILRLRIAKKLLDFTRETSKGYLITEIEMPF